MDEALVYDQCFMVYQFSGFKSLAIFSKKLHFFIEFAA
jgi:hypothetical protein